MSETQASINEWQRATFPSATGSGIVNHLKEEFGEFLDEDAVGTLPQAAEEAADLMILLYCWADHNGIDLHAEIDRKMAKNRARQWHIQPDGTGRHA